MAYLSEVFQCTIHEIEPSEINCFLGACNHHDVVFLNFHWVSVPFGIVGGKADFCDSIRDPIGVDAIERLPIRGTYYAHDVKDEWNCVEFGLKVEKKRATATALKRNKSRIETILALHFRLCTKWLRNKRHWLAEEQRLRYYLSSPPNWKPLKNGSFRGDTDKENTFTHS